MWTSRSRRRAGVEGAANMGKVQIALVLLLVVGLGEVDATGIFAGLCPEPLCDCLLDTLGRMEIACVNGHMTDIPMNKMNPSTEVIKIIAPPEKPNYLTIGRMFRQFKRLEELHIVRKSVFYLFIRFFFSFSHIFVVDTVVQREFTE